MKNSVIKGNKNYIFEATESDYPNIINNSLSEYDIESLNNSTRANAHKSKRLMISSKRSSKQKVPEIQKENLGNSYNLKTEIPNQKVIFPYARTEEDNDPKNLSFTYNKEEETNNKTLMLNSNKIILGGNNLQTHRSDLIDILKKKFPIDAYSQEIGNGYKDNRQSVFNNKSIDNLANSLWQSKINSNDKKHFLLEKKENKNCRSKNLENFSNEKDANKVNNDNLADFDDNNINNMNINETSFSQNQNSKTASNIFNYKKENSQYVYTQRSDNFHKKNYENSSSFRKTYDNFNNNYTINSKSNYI